MVIGDGLPPEASDSPERRRAKVSLPPVPASARTAREFIRSVTGRAEDPAAALVVTELVTNAVLHGQPTLDLTVEWDGMAVLLEVHDQGGGQPIALPLNVDDARATSGRGLALVAHISDDWGIRPDAPGTAGKAVWARVTLG